MAGAGVIALPAAAAAALFLERQHLARPRSGRLGPAALARFAADVGGIQLDSINVLDRAHYLTLWSRFGRYDRAALDRVVHRRDVVFEYWAHAACLVPVADLPAWRRAMLDYRHTHTGWGEWLRKKHPRVLRAVLAEIDARGPLGNADFAHARPKGAQGWWDWKPAQHALHWLWMTGAIAVHSRVHFHKRYDRIERVLPAVPEALSPEAFLRWHFLRSLRAMGAATERDLRMYLTFPRQSLAARRAMLRRLVKEGVVVELTLAADRAHGATRAFALAEDVPALATAARRRRPSAGTTLLSPFDSFLWHRERTRRLFGFDYRIEVYTPGPKRTHGYYTLPILHDGRLIGRLDAKNHRERGELEVHHVSFEPWFAKGEPSPRPEWGAVDRDAACAGLADALHSLARFERAGHITLRRVSPAALKSPLRAALVAATPAAELATAPQ